MLTVAMQSGECVTLGQRQVMWAAENLSTTLDFEYADQNSMVHVPVHYAAVEEIKLNEMLSCCDDPENMLGREVMVFIPAN